MANLKHCTVEEVELTKEFAEYALSVNGHNRPIAPSRVNLYAKDMINGDWTFNGEPIIFSTDGMLIQGQHRLHAFIKSGCAKGISALVVRLKFDDDNKAFKTLDCGLRRTYGQVLKMENVQNSRTVASIRNAIHIAMTSSAGKASNSTLDHIGQLYSSEFAALSEAGFNFVHFGRATFLAGLLIAARATVNAKAVADFAERVHVGAGLGLGSPELALKNYMFNHRSKSSGNDTLLDVSAVSKTFLASQNGESMRFVRQTLDGLREIKAIAEKNGVQLY